MSTSAVIPPPGFELERGEHLAVTPPPGFELEDQPSKGSIQLPPGFELGNQASKDSIQLPPGFELEQPNLSPSSSRPKTTSRITRAHPVAGPRRPSSSDSDATTIKFFNDALAKFSDSNEIQGQASSGDAGGSVRGNRNAQAGQQNASTFFGFTSNAGQTQPDANPVNVPRKQAPKPAQNIPGLPYAPLTPEQQAEIQHRNAAIRAREAEDNRLPDPTDDDLYTDPFQIRGPVRSKAQERKAETKSIVPDWAMPGLAWFQSHVNDPLDSMGEAGGKFVGYMLEGGAAAIVEGKGGYAEPGEAFDPESGLPLPRPEDYAPERVEEFRKDHPVAYGGLRGIGNVVGGTVADPRNWRGLPGWAQRAISTGFTVQMAKTLYEAADQVQRIWDDPNIPLDQKYEAITNSVLSALMAGASASHAMHTEAPPPLEARLVEQLNRMGEEAKQQIYLRLQDKLLPRTQEIRAGDTVTLKDGSKVKLKHVAPEMGKAVVRMRIGLTKTIALDQITLDRTDASGIEFVLAESPHPRQKATPSAEQIYRANASAPQEPVTKEGPNWDFQRRTCGPVEYLFKGGGEQVQADGPITSEGFVLDAKHVGKPKKSPFITTSGMKYNIRQWINKDLEQEFRRYAAIIRDPNTPIVGLKIITNDRRAVPYFLELMTKYGIPGRIVFK